MEKRNIQVITGQLLSFQVETGGYTTFKVKIDGDWKVISMTPHRHALDLLIDEAQEIKRWLENE